MPELTPNLRYQVKALIDGEVVLVNAYSDPRVAERCKRVVDGAWIEDSHLGADTLDYKEWWDRNR